MLTPPPLPLQDLLQYIIPNGEQPKNLLANLCLVNKVFCEYIRPLLYRTICIPSSEDILSKITKLFHTLSLSKELAWIVEKLGGGPITIRRIHDANCR